MKRLSLALAGATALVMAASLAFAQIKSGLQVGESCGPFQVVDVSGPKVGQQHCHV